MDHLTNKKVVISIMETRIALNKKCPVCQANPSSMCQDREGFILGYLHRERFYKYGNLYGNL